MTLKARVSSHRPADQTLTIADFHTSAAAADAASPSQLIGFRSTARTSSLMPQLAVADADGEVGARPHGWRYSRFSTSTDEPAVGPPDHALAVRDPTARRLVQGHVELEVDARDHE